MCEALQRASGRGVRCRLLLDAVGAKPGLRAFAGPLRNAGVDVRAMLAGGLRWRSLSRMDLRNHRKLALIDRRIGYVGSQNLADAGFVPGHPNRELVARVRVVLAERAAAVMVPEEALVPQGDKQFIVKVVTGENGPVSQRIEVATGLRRSGKVEILSGLAHGDTVVTAGQARLMRGDGMPLRVVQVGPGAAPAARALRESERARRAALGTGLSRAADAYIVRRGLASTIVAGYPWFTDWGRDTFISPTPGCALRQDGSRRRGRS